MKTFMETYQSLYDSAIASIWKKAHTNILQIPSTIKIYIAANGNQIVSISYICFRDNKGFSHSFDSIAHQNPVQFFQIIDLLNKGKLKGYDHTYQHPINP